MLVSLKLFYGFYNKEGGVMTYFIQSRFHKEDIKYIMHLQQSNKNPFKIVFDTKELFEETLLIMAENFLKEELYRSTRFRRLSVTAREKFISNLAEVIFGKNINSIEEVASLMDVRIVIER